MILRIVGIWLLMDGVGSLSLRHRSWKQYRSLRGAFETTWRVARVIIGITLVMVD